MKIIKAGGKCLIFKRWTWSIHFNKAYLSLAALERTFSHCERGKVMFETRPEESSWSTAHVRSWRTSSNGGGLHTSSQLLDHSEKELLFRGGGGGTEHFPLINRKPTQITEWAEWQWRASPDDGGFIIPPPNTCYTWPCVLSCIITLRCLLKRKVSMC